MSALLLSMFVYVFQDTTTTSIEESFTVNYVYLDVVVTDRSGNPVTGLTAKDFVVTENRKKVQVENFDVLDYSKARMVLQGSPKTLSGTGSVTAPAGLTIEETPQFIIVLDLEGAPFANVRKTLEQTDRFLDSLELEQRIALKLYSMEYGMLTDYWIEDPKKARQVLLSHKEKVIARTKHSDIEATSWDTSGGKKPKHSFKNRNLHEFEATLQGCYDQVLTAKTVREYHQCLKEEYEDYLLREQDKVRRTIGQLEILTYRFRDIPGVKNMLFVSPGFSLNPGQSAQMMHDYYRYKHNPNRSVLQETTPADDVSVSTFELQARPVESFRNEFRKVVHACIRNRVVFNTIDITNFNTEIDRRHNVAYRNRAAPLAEKAFKNYKLEVQEGARDLADQSGGRFFSGVNLGRPMRTLINEKQHIYVLAYQAPSGKPGKFRKIKVKVKRKGVELRYRKGYFGS